MDARYLAAGVWVKNLRVAGLRSTSLVINFGWLGTPTIMIFWNMIYPQWGQDQEVLILPIGHCYNPSAVSLNGGQLLMANKLIPMVLFFGGISFGFLLEYSMPRHRLGHRLQFTLRMGKI